MARARASPLAAVGVRFATAGANKDLQHVQHRERELQQGANCAIGGNRHIMFDFFFLISKWSG